jgi:hypothetical protein
MKINRRPRSIKIKKLKNYTRIIYVHGYSWCGRCGSEKRTNRSLRRYRSNDSTGDNIRCIRSTTPVGNANNSGAQTKRLYVKRNGRGDRKGREVYSSKNTCLWRNDAERTPAKKKTRCGTRTTRTRRTRKTTRQYDQRKREPTAVPRRWWGACAVVKRTNEFLTTNI